MEAASGLAADSGRNRVNRAARMMKTLLRKLGIVAPEPPLLPPEAEDGTPFDWDRQTGNTVQGKVRGDAVKDDQPTSYKYDVEIDGVPLDPVIIIEP